ncbi:MAG: DUF58 domain-containing protein [Robiginitomaculum sp.]|nr:DUF58 domain-containing protein [Robiginitomaculum sp.]
MIKQNDISHSSVSVTKLAVLLMAGGIPLTLLLAFIAPSLWAIAGGWIVFVFSMIIVDALLTASTSNIDFKCSPLKQIYIGQDEEIPLHIKFANRSPNWLELAVEYNDFAKITPASIITQLIDSTAKPVFRVSPLRRGELEISRFWLRWKGPLGLSSRTAIIDTQIQIPVISNIKAIREQAIQLFSRNSLYGIKRQRTVGEGTEFDSLREFVSGMDHRRIDWKASARHNILLAKEFRTERNHNIMIAIDTGHLMSEPLAQMPKLDHCLNAGLLLALMGLRGGDRVGFYSFDAEPGMFCKPLAHASSFKILQHLTASIDYSTNETNFTLGLSKLSQNLDRRSLIVIFTDFCDTTSAELMLENIGRLVRDHVVVFVTFADHELEEMVVKQPVTMKAVSQSVIAAGLLKERDLVLSKLHRLGVHLLETTPDKIGAELLSKYLELKTRGAL